MKKLIHEPHAINDMLCSKCHQPYEITVITNDKGLCETYLQCWQCYDSIPLQQAEHKLELETSR